MLRQSCTLAGALVALAGPFAPLAAQGGAIDPRVTVRAQTLERQGERGIAVDMLGRYLAVAQSDGPAWFELGRLYLLDARDWHRTHAGLPDGELFLDFASTAFDQAARLNVDAAVLFRAAAEVERAMLGVEADGWPATRRAFEPELAPPIPATVEELGRNLTGSCPAGGVLVTGDDLETVAAWYALLVVRQADEIVPLHPVRYATDARYRHRMAALLGVDSSLAVQEALAAVAARRPVCLTPGADPAAAPTLVWHPSRLVRLSRGTGPAERPLALTAVIEAQRGKRQLWANEVRGVYAEAARHNPRLCEPLAVVFGDDPPPACRP